MPRRNTAAPPVFIGSHHRATPRPRAGGIDLTPLLRVGRTGKRGTADRRAALLLHLGWRPDSATHGNEVVTALAQAPAHPIKTRLPQGTDNAGPQPLATFLGVFSIGLGLAEALAPRQMRAVTGVRAPGLLRAYGLRELLSGVGILTNRRPAFWLWSRVAGDTVDLATLAAAYANAGADDRKKILASAGAVLGVTVLDVLCAAEHSRAQQ